MNARSGSSGGSGGTSESQKQHDDQFLVGIARGFGGALLFAMPILMTMEMWWLGFYALRWKLAIFIVLMVPVIIAIAHFAGLKEDFSLREAALEGITACAIGIITSVIVLFLLGIIEVSMAPREIIGKIAIQSPTSAFGAVIARAQLGGGATSNRKRRRRRPATGARCSWWLRERSISPPQSPPRRR